MLKARWAAREHAPDTEVPATTRVLAIASGKGGVGKSSVTVNLAAAIAAMGYTVGVLDADIWGFSVPRMLGRRRAAWPGRRDRGRARPHRAEHEGRSGDGLLKVVSTGLLVDDEGTALDVAGPHADEGGRAVPPRRRAGATLDYLLIDMPPGTGDVQMGLARLLPRTDLIIVTTPALAAQKVAIRAADMARRSFLRVAGVIENMSAFTCDHGETYALFGEGGGQALADEIGVELLGQVPIEPAVAAGGDAGVPVALDGDGRGGRRVPGHRVDDRHRDRAPGRDGRVQRPAARGGGAGPRTALIGSAWPSLRSAGPRSCALELALPSARAGWQPRSSHGCQLACSARSIGSEGEDERPWWQRPVAR